QGTAQAFQASLQGQGMLLLITILVIYLVLGVLYESFVHPLTILSGLPSAGAGALLTLWLFGMELNVYGFVGMIMLIGIVKKNAIMMIDFAIEAERGGMAPREAIYQGCLLRFRPIMMTTMAALLGTLPIALGIGAGADARRPLGLAVVGGLLVSQLLTLYITPVLYLYMESAQKSLATHPTSPGFDPSRSRCFQVSVNVPSGLSSSVTLAVPVLRYGLWNSAAVPCHWPAGDAGMLAEGSAAWAGGAHTRARPIANAASVMCLSMTPRREQPACR